MRASIATLALVTLLALTVLVVVSPHGAHAFYEEGDDVVTLTPDNWDEQVMKSKSVWFVEFYAPWCGHCKRLTPEWKAAATALKGVAKLGAFDADKFGPFSGKFGIQGFPTIKVFGAGGKKNPTDYSGGRQSHDIVEAVLKEVEDVANKRMGKKVGGENAVVELTNEMFENDVMAGEDPWVLEFYAPWCGHCKSLAPQYKKAAAMLKDKGVKVGAVDATKHNKFNSKFKVQGFPTIVMLPKGGKTEQHIDYEGERTADAIAQWAASKK